MYKYVIIYSNIDYFLYDLASHISSYSYCNDSQTLEKSSTPLDIFSLRGKPLCFCINKTTVTAKTSRKICQKTRKVKKRVSCSIKINRCQ